MDDERMNDLRQRIDAALSFQDGTAMQCMAAGSAPLEVAVCLGRGRCLVPMTSKTPEPCPFCTRVPAVAGGERRVEVLLQRVARGH